MVLAVDVSYDQDEAFAAGVTFNNWMDEKPLSEVTASLKGMRNYIPGSFYLRELPAILELMNKLNETPEAVIIDGYVWLGSEKKDGLGGRLYKALNGRVPVIGVAKSAFKDTPEETKLFRGKSIRPLFITSAGMDLEEAKTYILHMHGMNRIPTLLKKADELSRRQRAAEY